jgi:hypothetical protein
VTELFGLRVLELEPERRRVRLRVFAIYDEGVDYDSNALLSEDASFFMRVLWDEADTRFGGGPLGERITMDEILDEDWVDNNTWHFVAGFAAVAHHNIPYTDAERARRPPIEFDLSWFSNEEYLPASDYDVWVTDPRWLAHLSVDQQWTTASYPTTADRLRPGDAPRVPVLRPAAATVTAFPDEYGDSLLAFSPDSRLLAAVNGAGKLVVFDTDDRSERLRVATGVATPSLGWLPGTHVVAVHPERRGYDVDTGAEVGMPASDQPERLVASADGSRVFVPDGPRVRVIEPATGAVAGTLEHEWESWVPRCDVRAIAVDPAGEYLAASYDDLQYLVVLRVADGESLLRLRMTCTSVAWSPDDRWLVAADFGGTVRWFPVGRPARLPS